ncbi:hypothetical protein EJ02DRAFT_59515 [Clathrospora elynae]|uniref:Uncharacterized protein n=1 Tax=Clathrospora elynae TaxID=706981 RepID=A0A6A5SZ64_9PLEO|nr:hypothetical protein EJ02DRAFT_59515 [Clathrospora elynae]
MARYQLRRPSIVKVFPRASSAPVAGQDSPESPDSFGSSGGEDSDSDDDEPHFPVESGVSATITVALIASSTPAPSLPGSNSSAPTVPASKIGSNGALPQITGTASMTTIIRPTTTSTVTEVASRIGTRDQVTATSLIVLVPPPAGSNTAAQSAIPQSQREKSLSMTHGGHVAATVLGVIGAICLIIGTVITFKRRKRRQTTYNAPLAGDAFNPSNTDSLHAPETAHVGSAASVFGRLNGGGSGGGDGHLTRSTNRSNTLFGAGPYARPETVSTEASNTISRFPIAPPEPTPNPFADPPLNKAYDLLNNRPRSTTLTDRGSWVKNPFKDPESKRFDPFGEMKEKARQERAKYVEAAKKKAELKRQFEQKERVGLAPDGMPKKRGSGVTVEGVGTLPRSVSGGYA